MKHTLLLSLFLLSSCALHQEFFGPQPKARPVAATVQPQAVTSNDISVDLVTDAKNYRSTDGAATLIVFQGDVQVSLKGSKMTYRYGHSVEIKIDNGRPVIQRVYPTDDHIVQFADSGKVIELMSGKKNIQIELYLDGTGLKVFTFNL